jgi:hypothetical protein
VPPPAESAAGGAAAATEVGDDDEGIGDESDAVGCVVGVTVVRAGVGVACDCDRDPAGVVGAAVDGTVWVRRGDDALDGDDAGPADDGSAAVVVETAELCAVRVGAKDRVAETVTVGACDDRAG